jgi:hypothetical protein
LSYGNQIILSETGVQQGDILGPVLFCLALHPVIKSLKSEFNGTLLDDSSFRIAIALRTGQPVCEPHTCICGAPADIFGHHGLFVVKVQEDVLAMEKSMYFMYFMLDSDF